MLKFCPKINYALQLIEPVIRGTASSFEVKDKATDAYNDLIQYRLSRSIFTDCVSWYRVGGNGKVTTIFPGLITLFWWWLRSPTWKDYKAVGAEKWAKRRRSVKIWRFVGLASLSVSLALIFRERNSLVQLWTISRRQVCFQTSFFQKTLSIQCVVRIIQLFFDAWQLARHIVPSSLHHMQYWLSRVERLYTASA
jgi:hypothetical protein